MHGPLIFQRPDRADGLVLVEGGALSVVTRFRQIEADASEAGGILIGFRRGSHLHVLEATVPQPTDKRGRVSFRRAAAGHAEEALKRWRETAKTADYLGEWHTHPERHATPSGIDRREWEVILRRRDQPMIFIIGGTEDHWFGLGVSRGGAVVKLCHC